MKIELTPEEIETLLSCVEYSKDRVRHSADSTPEARRATLDRLNSVATKLRNARKEHGQAMSRKSIRLDILKNAVAVAEPVFTTKDISENEQIRLHHPELIGNRNYHAFVGGALSDHRVALGIVEIQKSTRRGSRWRKA
jgi:hypothetical protein